MIGTLSGEADWIVQGTVVGGFINLKHTENLSLMILDDILTAV